MKAFKQILFLLLNILLIPISILTTFCVVWYILPTIQTTVIGIEILKIFSQQAMFWIAIASGILFLTFNILIRIFDRGRKAKTKNFFIHTNTWIMTIVAIALSITTFILAEIEVTTFQLTATRKICIGVSFILLFISCICNGKISKLVNRRIQAYETAKELNTVGRGSIILTNILKLLEILFPEVIMLALVCFCLSVNVATYFIIILVSFILPVLGNIECDFNIRREIIRNTEKEKDILVERISDNLRGE